MPQTLQIHALDDYISIFYGDAPFPGLPIHGQQNALSGPLPGNLHRKERPARGLIDEIPQFLTYRPFLLAPAQDGILLYRDIPNPYPFLHTRAGIRIHAPFRKQQIPVPLYQITEKIPARPFHPLIRPCKEEQMPFVPYNGKRIVVHPLHRISILVGRFLVGYQGNPVLLVSGHIFQFDVRLLLCQIHHKLGQHHRVLALDPIDSIILQPLSLLAAASRPAKQRNQPCQKQQCPSAFSHFPLPPIYLTHGPSPHAGNPTASATMPRTLS